MDNNKLLGSLSPEIHELQLLSESQIDENQLSNAAKGLSCHERWYANAKLDCKMFGYMTVCLQILKQKVQLLMSENMALHLPGQRTFNINSIHLMILGLFFFSFLRYFIHGSTIDHYTYII